MESELGKQGRNLLKVDQKHIRIASLSLLAFLVMFSYAIARPSAESLFLAVHSSKSLPYVWLVVAAAMFVVVAMYNWIIARCDLIRLLSYVSFISASLLCALLLLKGRGFAGVEYAIYVWKDIYVVVLVEIFYMYSNSVFPIKTARWIYGFFGAFAAAGSVFGNILVGRLATLYGTVGALWSVVPILAIIGLSYLILSRFIGIGKPMAGKHVHANMREAWRVAKGSSYLLYILALIFIVQIVITLIDFSFNGYVETAFPDMDVRTGIIGKVYAVINFGTFVLHLMTGPVLRAITVPGVLLAIPFILATSIATFIAFPAFIIVAAMKFASKAFDYTLFKSSKEILYIPLSCEEKTMGKSIVDMLSYRIAKGGASLLLMALIAVGLAHIISWVALALIVIWLLISVIVVKRFRAKVSREDEISSPDVVI